MLLNLIYFFLTFFVINPLVLFKGNERTFTFLLEIIMRVVTITSIACVIICSSRT